MTNEAEHFVAAREVSEPSRVSEVEVAAWVRVLHRATLVLAVPSAIAAGALMLHVVADVVGRTFFNHPLAGTLEFTQHWWMMIIVFLGLGYSQYRREHVRATVVPELLMESWQRVGEIASMVLMALVAILIGWYGLNEAIRSFDIREATPSLPPVAIWPMVFVVPLGCLALLLECIASIYMIAKGVDVDVADEGMV